MTAPIPLTNGPIAVDTINRLINAVNSLIAATVAEDVAADTSGDVVGPGSATDGAIALFNGTTGKLLKTGSGSVSGTNTGDQLTFKTIAVSGQSDVVADTTTDTLTLVAGTNITITTNTGTDAVTINASGGAGATDIDGLSDAAADYDTGNLFLGETVGDTVTTGQNNTSAGAGSLQAITSGNTNTVFGNGSGSAIDAGSDNAIFGGAAGSSITSGASNTVIGRSAGSGVLTTGTKNVMVGRDSYASSTGTYNTTVGTEAGHFHPGDNNTIIGATAGTTINNGSNNTLLGFASDVSSATAANRIAIGSGVVVSADNTFVAGTIGTKQAIFEGSNAAMGVATLSGGTKVVSNTLVTANSRIFLSVQSLGTITVPVGIAVSARNPGTSFTILSGNVIDTSVIAWEIKEPG